MAAPVPVPIVTLLPQPIPTVNVEVTRLPAPTPVDDSLRGLDWGSVPAWFAAVLSGLSVLLALSILVRDRVLADREQARLVSMSWTGPSTTTKNALGVETQMYQMYVTLANDSEQAIYRPHFVAQLLKPWRRIWFLTKSDRAQLEAEGWVPVDSAAMIEFKESGTGRPWDFSAKESQSKNIVLHAHVKFCSVYLFFTDSHGLQWRRDLHTGKLKRCQPHWLKASHRRRTRLQRIRKR